MYSLLYMGAGPCLDRQAAGHGHAPGPFISCPSVFVSCRESPFVNFARPGPDPSTVRIVSCLFVIVLY
ncbi:unnamed protein product [Linum trigynum]|uniref:Uncharacterized protein n=1 Tax=Linum trigynum TaxID=586398 RepID=A0AAV2G1P0_9ROSI